MIEIKNIHKSFDGNSIIKGISTLFEKGKTNLIIGQSGSGKTVLLKCLLGLHNPDSGEIIYDGVSNLEMTESEKTLLRRQMGMVFQGSALFDSMSVIENVMFPLDMLTDYNEEEIRDKAKKAIERVELTREFNITTIVNSHDMNSVVEIGEKIVFLVSGVKNWEGTNKEILKTDNKSVTDFVYSSELLKKVKNHL
jgi:phospholipid/cholesterol/gamma-HCH transport system ATP-binding protein